MTMEPRCNQFRSKACAPADAQRRLIERELHVAALAHLEREADRDFPQREDEIEQRRTIHAELKRQAREASESLKDALLRDAAARVAYTQLRVMHERALLESADPAIADFLVDMSAERDAIQEGCRNPCGGSLDAAAVNARLAAITTAVEDAALLRVRPNQAGVRERLAALRLGLPAVSWATPAMGGMGSDSGGISNG